MIDNLETNLQLLSRVPFLEKYQNTTSIYNLIKEKYNQHISEMEKDQVFQKLDHNDQDNLIKAFTQSKMNGNWSNEDTWLSYLKFLRKNHYSKGNLLYEDHTNTPKRKENLNRLIKASNKFLWINFGGINKMYFEKNEKSNLENTMKETLNKYHPTIITTFGWPKNKKVKGWPIKTPNENEIIDFVSEIPILKVILDYSNEVSKDKSTIIALKERMENHFAFGVGKFGNIYASELAIEALHLEDQEWRNLFKINEEKSFFLEIGLILNHLENLRPNKESIWL